MVRYLSYFKCNQIGIAGDSPLTPSPPSPLSPLVKRHPPSPFLPHHLPVPLPFPSCFPPPTSSSLHPSPSLPRLTITINMQVGSSYFKIVEFFVSNINYWLLMFAWIWSMENLYLSANMYWIFFFLKGIFMLREQIVWANECLCMWSILIKNVLIYVMSFLAHSL